MMKSLWTGITLGIVIELIDSIVTFPDEMLTVRIVRALRHPRASETSRETS